MKNKTKKTLIWGSVATATMGLALGLGLGLGLDKTPANDHIFAVLEEPENAKKKVVQSTAPENLPDTLTYSGYISYSEGVSYELTLKEDNPDQLLYLGDAVFKLDDDVKNAWYTYHGSLEGTFDFNGYEVKVDNTFDYSGYHTEQYKVLYVTDVNLNIEIDDYKAGYHIDEELKIVDKTLGKSVATYIEFHDAYVNNVNLLTTGLNWEEVKDIFYDEDGNAKDFFKTGKVLDAFMAAYETTHGGTNYAGTIMDHDKWNYNMSLEDYHDKIVNDIDITQVIKTANSTPIGH